ncbi:hypothetical protein AAF712_012725 [Marasmius tenuissimus]|uniref:Uncharacterized protein n=1 Tax=Marasmius tenuissimus TaxID=585030 RepID=A0ABR2ZJ63_9AGAR
MQQQMHHSEAPPTSGDVADIEEFERRNNILAHHRVPSSIAMAASHRIFLKYDKDYHLQLLDPACRMIESRHPVSPYRIPGASLGDADSFAELVLHVFARCVTVSQHENKDNPTPLPPPASWPAIFPAYSTLEAHQDRILQESSRLLYDSEYLRESNNPGLTSLFVLPFLELLKARRSDPLVVLAVHMQTLYFARYVPAPLLWIMCGGSGICKEHVDEFLGCQEVRKWLDHQPETVREECAKTVTGLGLETRDVWLRSVLRESECAMSFMQMNCEL